MQREMYKKRGSAQPFQPEQIRGGSQRDAVGKLRGEPGGFDIAQGHQRQGAEEMLAELPVRHPRRIFLVRLEGKRVDMDRLSIFKLYIECRGVLQTHAACKRHLLYLKCGQRRLLKLRKTPFIGIGNKTDVPRRQ